MVICREYCLYIFIVVYITTTTTLKSFIRPLACKAGTTEAVTKIIEGREQIGTIGVYGLEFR
jgi:hypothetical protein